MMKFQVQMHLIPSQRFKGYNYWLVWLIKYSNNLLATSLKSVLAYILVISQNIYLHVIVQMCIIE